MDNKSVTLAIPNNQQRSDGTSNTHSALQHETLQLSGKNYRVSGAVIRGLKLCRAIFSLGGYFQSPENYFNHLIDKRQNTDQPKPISERQVTHTQISTAPYTNRPLPAIPKSKPGLNSTMQEGLSRQGKAIQDSVLSAFSSLKTLSAGNNKKFTSNAQDPDSVERFNHLAEKSKNLKTNFQNSLCDKDNKTEEAKRFKSIAIPKYTDIPCHRDYCASAAKAYHATFIDMPHGHYIAAQGPTSKTEENYLHLLKENNSPISVALVGKNDLKYTKGQLAGTEKNMLRVGPINIGESKTVSPQKNEKEKIIAKEFEVELVESIDIPSLNFRIDKLKIDGKTHFRVNEMDWEDYSGVKPERLVAVSLIVEKLRKHPEVADRIEEPIVVNCNAGVGRTGTFITADDTVREYLSQGGQYNSNFDQKILHARERRNLFVQSIDQYRTLSCVHQNLPIIAEPIIKALEQLPTDKSSDNISLISGSSSIPEESKSTLYPGR